MSLLSPFGGHDMLRLAAAALSRGNRIHSWYQTASQLLHGCFPCQGVSYNLGNSVSLVSPCQLFSHSPGICFPARGHTDGQPRGAGRWLGAAPVRSVMDGVAGNSFVPLAVSFDTLWTCVVLLPLGYSPTCSPRAGGPPSPRQPSTRTPTVPQRHRGPRGCGGSRRGWVRTVGYSGAGWREGWRQWGVGAVCLSACLSVHVHLPTGMGSSATAPWSQSRSRGCWRHWPAW